MSRLTEPARLREFWDARYAEFSLSESGWMGAPDGLNDRIYACKRQALRRAIDAAGFTRDRAWSVLDAGCGQGHFARFYRDEYPSCSYLGLDISERVVAYLQRSIPDAEFRVADLSAWDDPDGRTFDIVQSVEVLHLILDDDAMMRALCDFAKRSGTRRVALRVQGEYSALYQRMIAMGARVRWTDLRMSLAGYEERLPERGVLLSNWEI